MLFPSIYSCQVELPAQIPGPGLRMWALGRLLLYPNHEQEAKLRRVPAQNPRAAETTPGSENQAPG